MMDTSRIYFEHPPSFAAIQTVHGNNKINGFSSITPAKAKRSWGDILRIPGRSKKNSTNAIPNQNSPCPPVFNSPYVSPYPADSYVVNSNITVRQYDPYGREYVGNYGSNFGSYNTTYSRASINTIAPKNDSKLRKSLENKSVSYTDWFGTVSCKQPSPRVRLNSPNNPFYVPEHGTNSNWNGLCSVRSPSGLIPATIPVQLYSNLCLCPEQLYSTKTKLRKKCKKCGCKIATIRNATALTTTKIRPVIPPNFYQPPNISWQLATPVPQLPPQYNPANNHPDVKSTFSPLEEVDECESSPRTPETIKSTRSSLSANSNTTITKSRIRPPNAIPHPPKIPLPSIPTILNNKSLNNKYSIMDQTRTAYELMDDTDDDQKVSDTDDVSDNVLNNSYKEKIQQVFSPVGYDALSNNNKKKNISRKTRNTLSTENYSSDRQNKFMNTFSDASNSSIVKFRCKSSPNIANNLDLANNNKNLYKSSIKEVSNSPRRLIDRQYENKTKRCSDISSFKQSSELPNSYEQKLLSKSSSHQSLLNDKTSLQKISDISYKSKFRPIPPRRDETKLVSIAGQRILFDKGQSLTVNNTENPIQKHCNFSELQNKTSIDAWENIPEKNYYSIANDNSRDNKFVTSLREPNESNVNQILKPFTKRRNIPSESKSVFCASSFDMTIKEEDELEDPDHNCENLSKQPNLNGGIAYEESDISSVSDSSPERNNRFQSSLSDLLHVKSILKRPNSVDTSSENDSDFYLPTFSEFKQMQKKKKSVQFLNSMSSSALLENGADLSMQVDRELFHQEIEKQTNLISGITEGCELLSCEPNIDSNQIQAATFMENHNENLSDFSNGLYHCLDNDQRINTKDNGFSTCNNSSKIPICRRSNPGCKEQKKTSSSSIVSIPNRPTVPPPPPPLQHQKIKPHGSKFNNDCRTNMYDLSSISRRNKAELEAENETHSNSSRCSTPPPLPSSSPPPLEENILPVQILNNLKENGISKIIDTDISSYKKCNSFENSDQSTFSSRIPILANKELCSTIHKYSKVPTDVDITTDNTIFKSSNRKIPRTGIFKKPQVSSCQNIPKHKTDVDHVDERFNDHIYEELRSITSSPSSNERSLSPEKSIFDGASKYEILEFLRNARKRVKMDDEDDELFSETIRNEMEVLSLEDDECRVKIEPHDDMILSSIYRDGRSSNRSSNSDSSENSGLLRSDKERLLNGEIERTDSGVGSETSKPTISVRQQATASHSDINGVNIALRERNLPPCDDCDFPVEAKVTNGGLTYAPLVCLRCSRRRQERKEILMEIIETEVKYGRDLKVMMDQFYKPLQVAGLLTRDQLRHIFINIEELVDHNRQFALQIKDAYEIALDQGDEDFLTVNVAKLFLNSSSMLHSFQSYCVRQSEASIYLQNLERDRELFRIFLRVSQMENTLLRRMNLHSFLMVPVQRITKYPLLLSRLYKTTPPSHSSREDCRKAREKIELFLQHINNETKGSSSTKLWRRISMSVGGSNAPPKRTSHPPDYDTSLKLRAVALEVLDWVNEEAVVVREGRLLCLPPDSGNWTRRGRGIKMASVQVALITLGRPTATLEEKIPEDGLITQKNLGIKEAAILAFKDHRLSKSALIRDPWLLSKVVLSWDSEGETESFEITDMTTKETFIFRDRDSVSTEEWFRSVQFHALSVGSWRQRRPALANIMINGARS